jgi:hypothetical protein
MTEDSKVAGKKFDDSKCMVQLLNMPTLYGEALVLTIGAKKYGANNWKLFTIEDKHRFVGAMLRHLMAYANGELFDQETGLSHLYHLRCESSFADYMDIQAGLVPDPMGIDVKSLLARFERKTDQQKSGGHS